MSVQIGSAYQIINDKYGRPIDCGSVFIGQAGQNPEVYPIQIFYDEDFTIAAPQPLKTTSGYFSRNGSPAKIFINSAECSISVRDKYGVFQWSDLHYTGILSGKGIKASDVSTTSGDNQQEVNDKQADINENQAIINARTITPYDFGAIGDGLAHPLSERYLTLAAAQMVYPFATSLSDYIDWCAIQAWWTAVTSTAKIGAECEGKFRMNKPVANTNTPSNPVKTKAIEWNAYFYFEGSYPDGFTILSPRHCAFSGFLEIQGDPTYANRNIDNLLYITDFVQAKFTWKCVVRYAKYLGLRAPSISVSGNNNMADLGAFQFDSCGRKFSNELNSFTNRTNTGSTGGVDQRSILTLTSAHNLNLTDAFVEFDGKPYLVTGYTATTITVYPCLLSAATTGNIRITSGGNYKIHEGDSNMIKITASTLNCAIANISLGFYTGSQDQKVTEFCDIGMRLGNGVNAAQLWGSYHSSYFEGNVFDVVSTSVSADETQIFNPTAFSRSKSFYLVPTIFATNTPSTGFRANFNIYEGGKVFRAKNGQFYDGVNQSTTLNLKIGDEPLSIRGNSPTVTLKDDIDIRRLWGNCEVEFSVFGTTAANGTTGVTTIKCDSGYTLNGSATDIVVAASATAFKIVSRLVNNTDWRVMIYRAGTL